MAMNGSFAGGLADGLRNGMAIAQAYDVSKDRAREREEADRQKRVNREIAAAMGGTRDQLQAPAGLEPVQGPQAVAAGDAMGGGPGLQPVATSAPVAPAMATAQSLGLADVSTGGAGLGATQAGLPSAGQSAAMAQKVLRPLITSGRVISERSRTD